MNILAIIPARGGSKRLKGKNIKMLLGKPLIAHSIGFAQKCNLINKIVVSTENEEIKNTALQFGAEVIDRPVELAQDTTKTAPVLIDVVEKLEQNGYKPDIIILLQATCPVRQEGLAEKALDLLINSENDSIFTAFMKSYTMATWKVSKDNKIEALYDYHLRPRWQDVEVNDKLFGEDGAFYAIKYDAFKKCKDFIGENPLIFQVERTVDIDTQEDFDKAEVLMKGKQ